MASPQMTPAISETNFPGLKLRGRGKVRDIYELGDQLLIVATDRLSAFDVVLPTPIPDKGKVLTQISLFWFDRLAGIVPNHVIAAEDFNGELAQYASSLDGRAQWLFQIPFCYRWEAGAPRALHAPREGPSQPELQSYVRTAESTPKRFSRRLRARLPVMAGKSGPMTNARFGHLATGRSSQS